MRTVTVTNPEGLHMRPITLVTQRAAEFASAVSLRRGESVADAKAMMALLTLAAGPGDSVTVEARGADAAAAADAIAAIVAAPE